MSRDLILPSPDEARARVAEALERRLLDPALASLQHVRMFDGGTEGVPGLFIERFGDPEDRPAFRLTGPPALAPLRAAITEGLGNPERLFWRNGHADEGGPEGDDGVQVVVEGGLKYEVRLLGQRNSGLFPQVRPARRWLAEHSRDRRVLNLFAYTCAFGVVAAAHGASSTVNVDVTQGVLARGKLNYALNALPVDGRTFWKIDVAKALKGMAKRGVQVDGVLIDPPPRAVFDKGKRWRFDPARDLERTVAASAGLLSPGGWLVIVNAGGQIPTAALLDAANLGEPVWTSEPDADCPQAPGRPPLEIVVAQRPR